MTSLPQSLILGAVQGLTEFLPISSSGHLILVREILKMDTSGGLAFDAVLQLGTALAVFIYFFRDIMGLVKNKKFLVAILVGTVPGLVLGILLEDAMDTIFRSSWLVASALITGSILMLGAERLAKFKTEEVKTKQAWWIGCFQALALIPGVSRSGATISGGLILGLKREAAARFSFLLSLPIVAGSGLKKLVDVLKTENGQGFDYLALGAGFLTAFVVGLVCIHYLIRYLKNNSLLPFVWYRLILAGIILIWF